MGKIACRSESLIDQRVSGEFLAVVVSKGVDGLAVRVKGGYNRRADFQRALVKRLDDKGKTASPFHHCNQDLTRGRADHGVHLVVSDALAVFDFGRSFIYHALARNAAAPLSGRAAPAIAADFVTQVRVEIPACLLVRPQTPVDGLVADRNDAFEFHPVADFLGTPLRGAQLPLNVSPTLRGNT